MPTTIRSLRLERGLSVSEVAATIGVTAGHLHAIERGTANLTLRLARKLATILDIPIETLIQGRPRQCQAGARRGRRRRSLMIGDLVEIVAGPFSGVRGVVDKPPDERPNPGLVGIRATGPVGSGSYEPACVRRITRRALEP